MGLLAQFTQMAFIDDRNYTGGPNAFEEDMFGIPLDQADNAAGLLGNWLCDIVIVSGLSLRVNMIVLIRHFRYGD